MTLLKVALLVTIAAAASFVAGLVIGKPKGTHFDRAGLAKRKATVIEHQVAQIEGDYALVIGDSIVERARLETLCGLPVINAGISGSTLEDLRPLLERVGKLRPARLVVLAGGINSFRIPGKGDAAQWEQSFVASLDVLGNVDAVVSLIDSVAVDSREVRVANSILRRQAAERNITVVPPIPAEFTLDGVHPSPEGYAKWKDNLERACARQ